MNKLRKILLAVEKKLLTVKYVISEKWYIKSTEKYYRHFGVNFEGHPKFIARDCKMDSTDPSKIFIGDGTVLTARSVILCHDYSIECGLVAIGKEDSDYESIMIREVHIGNNCFIGQNSFILPGTEIGDNCIIGAGSVVRGKIPANSIVCGNPATVVADTREWAEKKHEKQQYERGSLRRK